MASKDLPSPLVERLIQVVGKEHVMVRPEDLVEYSTDATFLIHPPHAVVRPANTAEVAAVLSLSNDHGVPVTTRGGGTGLSGGAVPLQGGVVLSTRRLLELEVDPASLTATAGAGVLTGHLATEAAKFGLMYPPDPASLDICTIGGNIATNAGGPSCLKYGVTSEYVQGLEVVLADGRILDLGGKSRKRAAGYRLGQLFVGSEGTLGVVTKATVRLIPMPRHRGTLLAAFRSLNSSAESVTALLQAGHLPAACELIDASSLGFVSDLLPDGFPVDAAAVLLVEQDGSDGSVVKADLAEIRAIFEASGAYALASDAEDAGRIDLWNARRSIGLRLIERRSHRLPEDVGVPIDRIPEMVSAVHDIGAKLGITVALFGHAGDGNLHPSLLFEDRDPSTLKRVAEAVIEIFKTAISLGGTVSAEHGLGANKREFAELDLGADVVGLMRQIKAMLDPKGILNPGKIFPSGIKLDAGFMEGLPGWL